MTREIVILDPDRKGKVTVKLFENLKKSGVSAENVEMIAKETMELLELI
ncbi:MAG: hypothetical protein HXX11_20575 [Desulfuromonadales bacterium]|nr:hypothetical protein [Desulfuromonadales bacterium]